MTVFVVSLFLPHTIHFSIPARSKRPDIRRGQPSEERLSAVLNRNGPQLDGGHTPNQAGPLLTGNSSLADDNDFFSKVPLATPNREASSLLGAPSPALTEPHTGAWGVGHALTQPPSRAGPTPPPSILKHGKIADDVVPRPNLTGFKKLLQPNSERGLHYDAFGRADWSVEVSDRVNGGLRNAIRAASGDDSLKEKLWVGTLGMPTDALEDPHQRTEIENKLEDEFESLTVWCKDSDMDGHYTHYCKQILWPVMHYQIPDNPKSKAYEDHSWVYYKTVNQAFADRIVKNYKRGDVIWVHDYHLMLVPAMVRKRLPHAQIGFFLHAAFPSSEVFRCLAFRNDLLEGLLGCNLIGFQTDEYCRHFLQTCSRLLCVEATTEGLQLEDRFVNVTSLAIGIDPKSLDEARQDPSVDEWIKAVRERYEGKKLIVARDKLDHVRGVRQKLLAYELFLDRSPEWRDKTVLIQVATAMTRDFELDATVSDIVSRINSTHATLTHQPVVFLRQDISFEQYLALLSVADALMITSLREGMNLTCHEFVFCQDGKRVPNRHGVLLLSEFTGSASVLGGSELSVNPWDYRGCGDAIKTALNMDAKEREERWQKLYDVVTRHTGEYWAHTLLERLHQVYNEQDARTTSSIPRLSTHALCEKYKAARQRLFILDYEGTLASWGSPRSIILTSPQRTIDVLNDLLLDPKNIVYVMSARRPEELDRLFGRVPKLGIIAENGCFLKHMDAERWTRMADPKKINSWKESVMGILKYYRERTEGSWIEERHCSLVLHYSTAADPALAARQASDCASHLNDAGSSQRVRAIPVAGALHVEPIDWSKATAASQIFDRLKEIAARDDQFDLPDFLMVAGDDRDDEPIFRWANELGQNKRVTSITTVCVGTRATEAQATLTQGVTGVLSALQKLAALPR
ncbi:MAG: telomerase inhibitor [Watsoniomyces obsoletus]|nr:MAG: telomerase inhibitor [Watsoniomyces obsoletus]